MSQPTDAHVMYCILGRPEFRPYMLKSVQSLRHSGYLGEVTVLTDLGQDGWDRTGSLGYTVRQIDPDAGCQKFGGKTVIDHYTRADRTLVLDCDTLIVAPLDELWDQLSSTELALCLDIFPTVWQAALNDLKCKPSNSPADIKDTIDACGTDAPYYNSGVLAFRHTERMRQLFQAWHAEWAKHKCSNQYALVRAIHLTGVEPLVLGDRYNMSGWNYHSRAAAYRAGVRILHFFSGPRAMLSY